MPIEVELRSRESELQTGGRGRSSAWMMKPIEVGAEDRIQRICSRGSSRCIQRVTEEEAESDQQNDVRVLSSLRWERV